MTSLLDVVAGDTEIEALLSDTTQVRGMIAVEAALAAASADTGWISREAAEAIAAALDHAGDDLDRAALDAGMAQDGVVVPALVGWLRECIPPPHRDALHKGATSQDIVDTALAVQLGQILDILDRRLGAFAAQVRDTAIEHGDRPLMAHTRMQAALPTTWAAKFAGWMAAVDRHRALLAELRPMLLVVQLGGPVGDRASFGGHGADIASGLAERLHLRAAPSWQTDRTPIVALGDWLARVSGTFGKIGADVALLSQTEIGAVRLAGGGGSSAMAHKSNPVAAEVLVALARFNAGLSGTLAQAMVHEYERSGAAWTLEWLTLPRMLVTTGASLRLGAALLRQLRFP